MKKGLIFCSFLLIGLSYSNAQFGGLTKGLSKNKNAKEEEKPAEKQPAAAPTQHTERMMNSVKELIGEKDLYYSARVVQKVPVGGSITPELKDNKKFLTTVNVSEKADGEIVFTYFGFGYSTIVVTGGRELFDYKAGSYQMGKPTGGTGELAKWRLQFNHKLHDKSKSGTVGMYQLEDGNYLVFIIPAEEENKDEANAFESMNEYYRRTCNNCTLDKIDIDVLAKTEEAAKAVNLDSYKAQILKMINNYTEDINKEREANANKQIEARGPLPKGMSNPTLEKTIREYIEGDFRNLTNPVLTEMWKDATLHSVYITSPDWSIEKDDLGRIKRRSISGAAVMKVNGMCFRQSYSFVQDYIGDGKYSGNLYHDKFKSPRSRINCAKVK